jgi:hypothetical protein
MDLKLGGRYKMGKKLGSGAFGEAYLGKFRETYLTSVHIELSV